jgi:hypothetical protein
MSKKSCQNQTMRGCERRIWTVRRRRKAAVAIQVTVAARAQIPKTVTIHIGNDTIMDDAFTKTVDWQGALSSA